MNKFKAVILLLRLPFLTVTLGAVFLGTSFAWWHRRCFNSGYFVLALAGACFLHIACNVANDYFDFKNGNDAANKSGLIPFSGGSRMVLDGFITPEKSLAISVCFAVLGSAVGIYLNFILRGNVILLIGIVALFFVYSYNGFPVKLVNKGLGEAAIFLAWGPLMVLGSYYVQTGSIDSCWPLIVALPSGIMTTLVVFINEFADRDADFSVGRKTWVIIFGYRKSLYLYLFLAVSCYMIVLAGVLFIGWPVWSVLAVITGPLPFIVFKTGLRNLENWEAFLPAVKATVLMNFLFLVILSISFLV